MVHFTAIPRILIRPDSETFRVNTPSRELAARYYPDVLFTRDIGEYENLLSNLKIRDVLGFVEEHCWRGYVTV